MTAIKAGSKVRLTQLKSSIGRSGKQKRTLEGLGLRKIGQWRDHVVTPQVQGMINKVDFLIKIEVL